jgi:hypothetical protein
MKIEHLDVGRENEATILIEGLPNELTLMHITDSHMVESDERDPEAAEHVESIGRSFRQRTPGEVPASQVFEELIEKGRAVGADFTALTGDITHFPSHAALDAITRGVESLGTPFLYTLGNHDWHFPHLEWNEETRQAHYPRFHKLTNGNPAYQAVEVGGVRLIALDNSNYLVSVEQLAFLKEQLATGQPCLLFIHIPLCLPSLMPAVMEHWQEPIMMGAEEGWSEEGKQKWNIPGVSDSTQACCQLLMQGAAENLAAIFCGHVHFPHADAFREDRYQYVTTPAFEGGCRVVNIRPL